MDILFKVSNIHPTHTHTHTHNRKTALLPSHGTFYFPSSFFLLLSCFFFRLLSIKAKKERLNNTSTAQNQKHSVSKNTTRWVLTICCALISGLTTVVIVSCTEKLVTWRTNFLAKSLTNNVDSNNQYWIVFGWYLLISLLLADSAACLCLYYPGIPEAIGSGIPEVKSYLNGIRVKKFNNPTLLWVKMVGSVLSVGSSMAVGMEGPLVMIGAYAGATLAHCGTSLSAWILKIIHFKHRCQQQGGCSSNCFSFLFNKNKNKNQIGSNKKGSIRDSIELSDDLDSNSSPILHAMWIWATSDLSYFANDAERRKLITIGAACGFAASFGAPSKFVHVCTCLYCN
jgi:hypothetical protein